MTSSALARAPRKDAAANRAGILAAATSTIARDPRASIDAIARSAGLTRRTLYGHFDDREALVREVLASGAVRFNTIAEDAADDPDPAVALARLATALWREAAHVQLAAAIALDDEHVADTAAVLAPLRRRLHAIVRDGQESGRLRTDVAAPTLARLIEEAARTIVTRIDASSPAAPALAVRSILGIAGLSWREAGVVAETAGVGRTAAAAPDTDTDRKAAR